MPSTRGIGSKMMCCCAPALFGTISGKLSSPNASCGRSSGQRTVASCNDIAILGQLYDYAKPDGFPCNALLDLVEEEICTPRGGFGLVEIFVACYRQHPIAAVAAHAVRPGKFECGDREKPLPGKAGRYRLWNLHKPQSRGMRAEELLDRIRVRPGGVGRNQRIEELHETLRGTRREAVDRMTDDVGVNMLAKVEANRKPARAGALRVVVGNGRNSRKVREADRHRRAIPVQMRRARQRSGFRRRRKHASQQDALRMRGPESRMNTTISFVEHLNGFSAQGHELLIRRQGHGSVLRGGLTFYHRRDPASGYSQPARFIAPTTRRAPRSKGAEMDPHARSRPKAAARCDRPQWQAMPRSSRSASRPVHP
jgi:hypothetical protein